MEWDSDSTMLLLHKRLHLLVNEANSHNRLLNCKNLVLEKNDWNFGPRKFGPKIQILDQKIKYEILCVFFYHYCCHYGTIFALALIEPFSLRPYEAQFDDIGFRKSRQRLTRDTYHMIGAIAKILKMFLKLYPDLR